MVVILIHSTRASAIPDRLLDYVGELKLNCNHRLQELNDLFVLYVIDIDIDADADAWLMATLAFACKATFPLQVWMMDYFLLFYKNTRQSMDTLCVFTAT